MTESLFPYLHNESNRTALVDGDKQYSYAEVNQRINRVATGLLGDKADLQEERIAFFIPASLDYVATMHGIWRAGGIAIPLNVTSAVAELDHYLRCASVTRMIANGKYQESLRDLCQSLNIQLLSVANVMAESAGNLPVLTPDRRAMML